MKDVTILLLLIIIVVIAINYYIKNKDITLVKSNIDGRSYRVGEAPDKQEIADLLAKINKNVIKLLDSLKKSKDERFIRLIDRYNPDSLGENLDNKSYKAYSLNKGEEISLCLRNTDNSIIQDMNTIMFVLLHELTHVMTNEIGHTDRFWENMDLLLKKSEEAGVYTPVDYSKSPVNYCGMNVNKSPYRF